MTACRRHALLSWVLLLIVDLTIAWGGFPRLHRLIRGVRVQRRRMPSDDAAIVRAVNDAIDNAAVVDNVFSRLGNFRQGFVV